MGKLIGVVATVLVAVAAATGVTFAVSNASAPDKSVNLENPASPNNMRGGSADSVNYGSTP
ncbi:hypothetical protein [Actinophytocola oryzae]|uniref:Small secreted domain DUF320 n=1 Tax=Actinophytocola oryzae TaxID=502181 RepID=A0A4V3FR15_9PSEU|nr:hypothetical protein [Actinophytocola oryzae]TDV41761.1 hypothetical protein CLV71_11983 [Actinophytocola oryzae]